MQKLMNTTQKITLVNHVIQANSFYSRAKGLLGQKSMDVDKTLWIHRCRDIHTWFMMFPIDAIFVNSKLQVTSIHTNIKPWRFVFDWKARSVFEFSTGVINKSLVNVGDQLHVDS